MIASTSQRQSQYRGPNIGVMVSEGDSDLDRASPGPPSDGSRDKCVQRSCRVSIRPDERHLPSTCQPGHLPTVQTNRGPVITLVGRELDPPNADVVVSGSDILEEGECIVLAGILPAFRHRHGQRMTQQARGSTLVSVKHRQLAPRGQHTVNGQDQGHPEEQSRRQLENQPHRAPFAGNRDALNVPAMRGTSYAGQATPGPVAG
jgi:hypothetical protein